MAWFCWYKLTKIKSWSKFFWVGMARKWVWPIWSQDSKIGCISRMNWWHELIFCMMVQIQKAKSYFNGFWIGLVKSGHGHLVHPSSPSFLASECFLGIWSLDFSGFCQGARNHYEVLHDNPIFLKNIFCPKNWGNGPKIGFLNLKENLIINFHWICSVMNMFIICCVPAQILCLGKILFLRCRLKYSWPIKLHNF